MNPTIEKRRALGRGLESLLPSSQSATHGPPAIAAAAPSAEDAVQQIAVELIDRNPYQTRRHPNEEALAELAASISANGVVQPIVVRPAADGRFQLIAGERRWLASQRAKKATVPAMVRRVSDEQAMEMTIVENLQREDLNPMEHARAFERLARDFSLTQEQMAQRTGKDRASVANYLRLLRLPEEVQEAIEQGALTFGHAKALMALETQEDMAQMARIIASGGMSVRRTEEHVANWKQWDSEPPQPKAPVDPNVRAAEENLQRVLGLRVKIRDHKGKGTIAIEYRTLEDFDRVVEALENGK
jgi:ParB family chromosome partitioning protein